MAILAYFLQRGRIACTAAAAASVTSRNYLNIETSLRNCLVSINIRALLTPAQAQSYYVQL